jgi:dTMP kinase
MKPLFIVVEGVDGSGKTTQINLLLERFKQIKHPAMDTFEPTDGPVGSLLRNVLKRRIQADQYTIAGLFLADRLDHINNPVNGMKKYMDEGYTVICSRYYFSTYAFQSEYISPEWLVNCNALPKSQFKPDLIIYLNVHPEDSMTRIEEGRVETELYETKEKLTKAHLAYLEAFEKYGEDENIHIIDGSQSIQSISDKIWDLVLTLSK